MPCYCELLKMQNDGDNKYQFEKIAEFEEANQVFDALKDFVCCTESGVHVAIICSDQQDRNLIWDTFCERLEKATGCTPERVQLGNQKADEPLYAYIGEAKDILDVLIIIIKCLEYAYGQNGSVSKFKGARRVVEAWQDRQAEGEEISYNKDEAGDYSKGIINGAKQDIHIKIVLRLPVQWSSIFEDKSKYFPVILEYVLKGICVEQIIDENKDIKQENKELKQRLAQEKRLVKQKEAKIEELNGKIERIFHYVAIDILEKQKFVKEVMLESEADVRSAIQEIVEKKGEKDTEPYIGVWFPQKNKIIEKDTSIVGQGKNIDDIKPGKTQAQSKTRENSKENSAAEKDVSDDSRKEDRDR